MPSTSDPRRWIRSSATDSISERDGRLSKAMLKATPAVGRNRKDLAPGGRAKKPQFATMTIADERVVPAPGYALCAPNDQPTLTPRPASGEGCAPRERIRTTPGRRRYGGRRRHARPAREGDRARSAGLGRRAPPAAVRGHLAAPP